METRIFIGSSGESLGILDRVEGFLKSAGECQRWTTAFQPNKSNLDSLIQQTHISDFSVLIAMKDDITITRGQTKEVARDNMIFEFGLFLGATGIRKSFMLVEDGIDLPSDLNGISLHRFRVESGYFNSLDTVCGQIVEQINANKHAGELGLLPSTALAMGYFNSFLKNVCDELHEQKCIYYDGKKKELDDFIIHIVVPKQMDANGVIDIRKFYTAKLGLTLAKTTSKNKRDYPFHFKTDTNSPSVNSMCHIHDVPTTLNTICECLRLLMPEDKVGPNAQTDRLEERELDNFCRVLSYYILRSSATRNHVVIERI